MTNDPNILPVITLHRYYIWANKIRIDFYKLLENEGKIPKAQYGNGEWGQPPLFSKMCGIITDINIKLRLRKKLQHMKTKRMVAVPNIVPNIQYLERV